MGEKKETMGEKIFYHGEHEGREEKKEREKRVFTTESTGGARRNREKMER